MFAVVSKNTNFFYCCFIDIGFLFCYLNFCTIIFSIEIQKLSNIHSWTETTQKKNLYQKHPIKFFSLLLHNFHSMFFIDCWSKNLCKTLHIHLSVNIVWFTHLIGVQFTEFHCEIITWTEFFLIWKIYAQPFLFFRITRL